MDYFNTMVNQLIGHVLKAIEIQRNDRIVSDIVKLVIADTDHSISNAIHYYRQIRDAVNDELVK